jgi:hypothetical protein
MGSKETRQPYWPQQHSQNTAHRSATLSNQQQGECTSTWCYPQRSSRSPRQPTRSANQPSDPQTRTPVQSTHVQTTTDLRTHYEGQTTGMVPAYFDNLAVDRTTQSLTQVQRSEFCIRKLGLNDKYSKLASNNNTSPRFTCFPPSGGNE